MAREREKRGKRFAPDTIATRAQLERDARIRLNSDSYTFIVLFGFNNSCTDFMRLGKMHADLFGMIVYLSASVILCSGF